MRNIIVILTIGLLAFSSFAGQRQPNDIRFTGYTWLEHNKELSIESGVFSVDSASTASIAADLTLSGATTISGVLQVNNTLTVGADGTSFDVLFYSDTAGDTMLWDSSAEALIITGTAGQTALSVADGNVAIIDDLDVDGTTNLDAVDIDGAVQIDGAVTVGTTGVGQDVIFESNTAGDLLQWSATDVTLYVTGTAGQAALDVRDGNVLIDDDLDVGGTITSALQSQTTANIGAVTASKATAVEYWGEVHQTVLTFTLTGANDLDLADGDHGTGQSVFTFPEGRILILGAAINSTVVNSANFNASDDDHYYVAIGTVVGADDNDLTSTEADIIAKTTVDTAAGATLTYEWEADMVSGGDSVFDGTASAVVIYANAAIEATDNSGANTFAFTGTCALTWVLLGDD